MSHFSYIDAFPNPQYCIEIADLPTKDGEQARYDFCGIDLGKLALGTVRIADQAMDIGVDVQRLLDGFLVKITTPISIAGECPQCLEEYEYELVEPEEFTEMVFFPEVVEELVAEGDKEATDLPVLIDNKIYLDPLLCDSYILFLSGLDPNCEPDCPGLCSECGQPWRDLPDDHKHEQLDPRFAALDGLWEDLNNQNDHA